MHDPILDELRRVRLQLSREMAKDVHGFMTRLNESHRKVCDVVISPTGEELYVPSPQKMYYELIAPREHEDPAAVAAAKKLFGVE
jgi:hypothetical protein